MVQNAIESVGSLQIERLASVFLAHFCYLLDANEVSKPNEVRNQLTALRVVHILMVLLVAWWMRSP